MKIGNLIRMLCSSFKFVIKMLCDLNGWFFLIIILRMEVGFCSFMSDPHVFILIFIKL